MHCCSTAGMANVSLVTPVIALLAMLMCPGDACYSAASNANVSSVMPVIALLAMIMCPR